MSTILLATSNPAKQEKLAWLLEGLGLSPCRPQELSVQLEVEENAPTHAGNAQLKATSWSRAVGGLAIASDGGLLIPALGSAWNSLWTARSAGPGADGPTRLKHLLELMSPFSGEERRVSWLEAVAVARDGEPLGLWQAQGSDGLLATSFDPEHVVQGFWVATIWYFPALGTTYAQLSERQREQVRDPWSQIKPQVQELFRRRLNQQGGKP